MLDYKAMALAVRLQRAEQALAIKTAVRQASNRTLHDSQPPLSWHLDHLSKSANEIKREFENLIDFLLKYR